MMGDTKRDGMSKGGGTVELLQAEEKRRGGRGVERQRRERMRPASSEAAEGRKEDAAVGEAAGGTTGARDHASSLGGSLGEYVGSKMKGVAQALHLVGNDQKETDQLPDAVPDPSATKSAQDMAKERALFGHGDADAWKMDPPKKEPVESQDDSSTSAFTRIGQSLNDLTNQIFGGHGDATASKTTKEISVEKVNDEELDEEQAMENYLT